MKLRKLLHLLVLVATVFFSFSYQKSASGQSDTKPYITDLDCSNFPAITLTLRAVDSQGSVLPGDINTSSFLLYDNETPVTNHRILASETGPKYIIFSIDRGEYSNLEKFQTEIRKVMNDFADKYFKEDIDKVTIIAHTYTNSLDVILPDTQSKDELSQAISHLDLSSSGEELEGLKGLDEILSNLDRSNTGRVNTAIIHFSRYIEGFTLQETIDEAKKIGDAMAAAKIKVYVFQTETSDNHNLYTPYQELAARSYGGYLFIPDKAGFQSGYSSILRIIDQNSKVYKVEFTSKEFVTDHTISVAALGFGLSSRTDSAHCPSIDIQNPDVVFDYPQGGVGSEYQLKPGDTKVLVKAHINWKDDKPRDIKKVELLANEEVVDTINETLPSDDTFLLELPIQSLMGSYPEKYLDLIIRVEDAWGLKGKNSTSINFIAPPSPTMTLVPTPTKKGAPPVSTQIITPPKIPTACEGGFSLKCAQSWVTSNWLFMIAVGIVMVLFILLISTRRQISRISAPAREALGKRVSQVRDQVRKTLLGGSSHRQEAIAYLQVLMARSDRTGIKIEIFNNRTTLGRDPSVTDVQLYNPDDKTSVSGLHCTIFYDPGQGKFLITDDNSTNGTYVNGTRLTPNEPSDLNDGDEIILGDVTRQGAKLRFEISARQPELPLEAEPPPLEDDFHVDLESSAGDLSESIPEPPPVVKEKPKKDFDETVPGYRDDEEAAPYDNNPREPPNPPPGSVPKKSKDKSWLDKLG